MKIQYPTFVANYKSDVNKNSKNIVDLILSLPKNKQGGYTNSFLARKLGLTKKEVVEAILFDWRQSTIGKKQNLTAWVNQVTCRGQLRNFIIGQY